MGKGVLLLIRSFLCPTDQVKLANSAHGMPPPSVVPAYFGKARELHEQIGFLRPKGFPGILPIQVHVLPSNIIAVAHMPNTTLAYVHDRVTYDEKDQVEIIQEHKDVVIVETIYSGSTFVAVVVALKNQPANSWVLVPGPTVSSTALGSTLSSRSWTALGDSDQPAASLYVTTSISALGLSAKRATPGEIAWAEAVAMPLLLRCAATPETLKTLRIDFDYPGSDPDSDTELLPLSPEVPDIDQDAMDLGDAPASG